MSCNNNAAIYIRISTDRDEQKTSLKNQKELCMEIIEERNWNLHKVYKDEVSGRIRERPQFVNLLADMEKGLIQYIVVKEGSRLARSVSTFERIRELSFKKNIHLLSADGELDTFTKGYECITQVGADAQKEAEKISRRVKNAVRMMAKRGEFIGSIPPYGYKLEGKKLYPREDDTPRNVKRIFNEYLAGKGASSIAKGLQEEGVPTPSMVIGKSNATAEWFDTTIYKILENEAYIGNLVQSVDETYFANEERKRKRKNKKDFIRRDGTHEPIIKKEIFQGVQELKASKPKFGSKAQNHIFSNILFCKDCGSRLIFKRNWGKGSYVCSKYAKKGAGSCSNHAINEDKLVSKLIHELSKFNHLDSSVFIQKAKRKLKQTIRKLDGQIIAKQFEIRRIKHRLESLEDEMLDYPLKKNELMLDFKKQQKKLFKLEKEIATVQNKILFIKSPETSNTINAALRNTFDFHKFDLATVNLFISKIHVDADKSLVITYRFNKPTSA